MRSHRRPLVKRLLTAAVVGLISLAVLEALLVLLRHTPVLSAFQPLARIARELYMLDRRMIQFEASAAQWDERLGYTLRPGEFGFANTEYETVYRVNRAGLRDDEASLHRPAFVVAGDSFAMGWGVEQDQAFPQRLEALSGRRVLNTAVASYGTARQLRLLAELDVSAATHLIFQFCNNDYFENLAYEREGRAFRTQTLDGYGRAVADYNRMRRYWPGRYALTLFDHRLRSPAPRSYHPDPEDPASQRRQAELFLEVLRSSSVELSALRIIVFELNAYNRHRGLFIPALREVISTGNYPAFIEEMVVVDLAEELAPGLWFRLDDHITAEGHELLAQRLWEIIQSTPPLEPE